nr:SGNH/GDSL hydrolase family protein [uncultured Rhodoferax sp.]
MLTYGQLKSLVAAGAQVSLALVGDSTTAGFGANPGANVWPGNGRAYGCMNNPSFGPNWDSASPYYLNTTGIPTQAQQDNVGIASATRLLRTYMEALNPTSKVYNFGGSGYTAATHVANGTVVALAALAIKPQAAFLALGINSAKNNGGQDADLRTLVAQLVAADILPILVKEHNVGVAFSTGGDWSATATPDQWYPMDNWPSIRANIDTIAADNSLEVLDLGTPDGVLNVSLLYDPFHPSNLGYQVIFEKYVAWLTGGVISLPGGLMGTGALRLSPYGVDFSASPDGALRVKSSQGVLGVALGVDGPVRIKTTLGVRSLA